MCKSRKAENGGIGFLKIEVSPSFIFLTLLAFHCRHERAARITYATCASLHVHCAGASSLVPDERPGAYAGDMRGVDYTRYEDFHVNVSTSLCK